MRRRGRVLVIVAASSIVALIPTMFALMAVLPDWWLSTTLITGLCLANAAMIALARAGHVTVSAVALLVLNFSATLAGVLAEGHASNAPIFLVSLVLIAGISLPTRALPFALVASFAATFCLPLVVGGRTEPVAYVELLALTTVVATFATLMAGVNNWVIDRSFAEAERLTAALQEANADLEDRVEQRTAALTAALSRSESLAGQLAELSARDPLTGLYNRRRLDEEFDRVASAAQEGECVSVVVADLDDFKRVNDTLGHHVGDVVLQRVAGALLTGSRASDVVARTGGEEFVLLMPDTRSEEAVACCERLRGVVAGLSFDDVAPGLRMTVSIGVATGGAGSAAAEMREMLVQQADEMLYAAKRSGKDRVLSCLWQAAPS
ncbi:GGDEF domain-containing protein [Kineococcus xinjiangensis]|uniref:GGDEF domain-containing protein n=1 Tax=Kineococcus xinjiangensis TaxID=512762 RepID=UPI0011B0CB9F|nr:GGDEF domain-containing protein [Kineococcus xinjiangensis]